MKNLIFITSIIFGVTSIFAQTPQNPLGIYINNVGYSNNSSVNINCGTAPIEFRACLTNGIGGCVSATCPNNWTLPSGWSAGNTSNSGCTITVYPDNTTSGQVSVSIQSGSSTYTASLNLIRNVPSVPVIYGPNPVIVCNGQNVGLDANSSNGYTYTWSAEGGAQVSVTGFASANISASGTGKVKVRGNADPSSGCPNSDWAEVNVYVTPVIVSKTVNGSAAQSANYVSGSAQLGVFTANSANNCNWSIDGGSGSISPSGFNCYASISGSFLRVKGQTSNNCGNGESYVFYLLNGSGYRMASSNPTKSGSPIQVVFDDKRLAEDLLEDMTLFSEKEKQVYKFDKEEAKISKYFKDKEDVEISTKGLEKGLYYLHVSLGGKKYTERLVIE